MPDMNGFSELMAAIDGPVRLLVYGELVLFVIILVTGRPPRRFLLPFLLLIGGLACYLYLSGPWPDASGPLRLSLIGFTSTIPFALWALALLIFDDGFRLPVWYLPAVFLIGLGAALLDLTGTMEPTLRNIVRLISLAALAQAIWVMVAGLRDDLVEERRLARIVIVGMILLQAGGSLITELALPTVADRAPLEPVSALLILMLTTGLAAVLLRPVLPEPEPGPAETQPGETTRQPEVTETDPLASQLHIFCDEGGLFETGLTIAVLAERLGVPEYRLRQTINRGLGFRNFSTFLNHHRVAEAKRRLRDPALVRLPVLTIAMDLGYGSLGPFNRAFREATGMTPTDYRRGSGQENSADS